MLKCTNAQTLKCSNAQMLSSAQMLKSSSPQMLKCSNAQMVKCTNTIRTCREVHNKAVVNNILVVFVRGAADKVHGDFARDAQSDVTNELFECRERLATAQEIVRKGVLKGEEEKWHCWRIGIGICIGIYSCICICICVLHLHDTGSCYQVCIEMQTHSD